MEEAELQVFPDTEPETELVHTVGNRQVCMGSVGVPGREKLGCFCRGGSMKWLLFCPQDELEQRQASVPPDSSPSLQSMGLLLDKLAKENQDIRLLQAQLQVGPSKREGGGASGHLHPAYVLVGLPQEEFSLLF